MLKTTKVHTFNPAIAQTITNRLKSSHNNIAAICAKDIGIDILTFKAELIRMYQSNIVTEPTKEPKDTETLTYIIGEDLSHAEQTILLSMTDYADEWLDTFNQRNRR